MSRILVIEPRRMLRQAIVSSLFPENDVQLVEFLPESSAVNDFDVMIVDAASLRETKGLRLQGLGALLSLGIPTIWIEGGESGQIPARDQVFVLQKPLSRESLLSALGQCRGISSVVKRNGTVVRHPKGGRSPSQGVAEEKKLAGAANTAEIIELVDVVEEGADPGKAKTHQKKQK